MIVATRQLQVNSSPIAEAGAYKERLNYGYGVTSQGRKGRRPQNSDQCEQSSKQGPRCSCGLERKLHHPLQQRTCEKESIIRSTRDCQGILGVIRL